MAAKVEFPFPPRRDVPVGGHIEPPWVPVAPRWEYREVVRDLETESPPTESELNELGREHWELAGVVQRGGRAYFYFKRERLA